MEEFINFTKYKTVKISNSEVPNNVFMGEMIRLITHDVDHYGVYYDYEYDYFKIMYDGCSYVIHGSHKPIGKDNYKKEIINELNHLCNVTKYQKEANKFCEEAVSSKETKTPLKEIEKFILNEEDKLKEIKERYKNNKIRPFSITNDLFRKINYGKSNGLSQVFNGTMALSSLSLIGGAIALPQFFFFWILLVAFGIVDGVIWILNEMDVNRYGWRGMYHSLISIIFYPLSLTFITLKKTYEKIKELVDIHKIEKNIGKRNAKLKARNIKSIESSLMESKDLRVDSKRIVLDTDEFEELKNKILSIRDKNKQKEYGIVLLQAIADSLEVKKNKFGPLRERDYSNIKYQMEELNKRVKEELEKEREQDNIKRVEYRLMSEITDKKEEVIEECFEKQKSIGTRS